jgi:hypothetical protein
MRLGLLAVSVTCAALGCGNAPGDVKGGEPFFPPAPDCSATSSDCGSWSHVYACYFATDTAIDGGCQAGTCHGTASGAGVGPSGFICGSTATACWQGLTMAQNPLVLGPLKTAPGLFNAFYKDDPSVPYGVSANNMPALGPAQPPYMSALWQGLTPAHQACIQKWVSAGAPNN